MFGIRNKKTGRLLVIGVETEEDWGYGIEEPVRNVKPYLELFDSSYRGIIFVASDISIVEGLIESGRCSYPDDIRIDFGYSKTKFDKNDLEIVHLQEQKR